MKWIQQYIKKASGFIVAIFEIHLLLYRSGFRFSFLFDELMHYLYASRTTRSAHVHINLECIVIHSACFGAKKHEVESL